MEEKALSHWFAFLEEALVDSSILFVDEDPKTLRLFASPRAKVLVSTLEGFDFLSGLSSIRSSLLSEERLMVVSNELLPSLCVSCLLHRFVSRVIRLARGLLHFDFEFA